MGRQEDSSVERLQELIRETLSETGRHTKDLKACNLEELVQHISIYHQELEFQNDELRRIGDELKTVSDRFEDLFMNAPVGYVIYDEDRRIDSVNRTLCSMLAVDNPRDLTGTRIDALIKPEHQDLLYMHVRSLVMGTAPTTCRLDLVLPQQSPITVRLESTLISENGQVRIRSAVIDVTAESQLSRQMAEVSAQLQTYHDRLEATMLAGNLAWWRMDLPSGAVNFNEQKSRMIGFPAERFKHYRDFVELVHPDDTKSTMNAMHRYLAGTEPLYRCEYRIATASGGWKWFQDTGIASERDENGRPVVLFGVVIDITDLKEAQLAAERANTAKSQFLAAMSHEIRTPLNAVIGFTDLLREASLTDEQLQYLDNANLSARNLLDIINDILDLSRIEAGRLDLVPEPHDLRELLGNVVSVYGPAASRKGLSFTLDVPQDLPGLFMLDPVRFRQLVVNLTGNAIKFTERGSVKITVGCEPDPGSSRRFLVTVSVQDTGIGISPEQSTRLFHSFSQADPSISRKFGGTGLGLVISAKLAAKMQGELTFQSERGEGSCFSFTVPLESVSPSAEATSKAAHNPSGSTSIQCTPAQFSENRWRILLAEDMVMNRMLAETLIKRILPNAHVSCASDGVEVISLFKNGKFDLVLMDVQMPEVDGLAATRMIREQEAAEGDGRHVPILGLSAGAMPDEIEAGRSVGMDEYLLKPIDAIDLENALRRFLCPDAV